MTTFIPNCPLMNWKPQGIRGDDVKGFYVDNQKDGTVRYRMAYVEPLTDKTKRVSVTFPTDTVRNRNKAQEILKLRITALIAPKSKDILLADILSEYIEKMSKTWRKGTLLRNKATLNRITRQFPSDTILNNITPRIWESTLEDMSHGSATTFNEYVTRVKAFLRWCYANDYLKENYLDKIKKKPTKDIEKDVRYLEPEQAEKLLSALQIIPRWNQIAHFMLLTGMRCGEGLALNDSDIDTYIRVTKTYNPLAEEIGPPKTPKSKRDVVITSETAAVIEEIRKYNVWLKETYGIKTDLFFFDTDGKYMSYYAFNDQLKEVSKRVLGFKVTTHMLRHTHASILLASGIPIDVISRRLGHETIAVTQRVYLHIIEKLKKRDADILQNVKVL